MLFLYTNVPTGDVQFSGKSHIKFLSGRPARTGIEREQARQEHLAYEKSRKEKQDREIEQAQSGSLAQKRARS